MDRLLSVKEVCGVLCMDKNRVYSLIKSGVLPSIKVGSYRVSASAVDYFISNNIGKDVTDPFNITEIHSTRYE